MTRKNSAFHAQHERRKFPRARVELVIQYQDLEHFCQDYARNLSLGGIFIETQTPLTVGSQLQLAFALPGYDGQIQTTGKVVRVIAPSTTDDRQRPGMAIQFEDLTEQQKQIIDALVKQSVEDF